MARITDAEGRPIPCKVILDVAEGATPLDFGPEGAVTGVKNLRYTPNGQFPATTGSRQIQSEPSATVLNTMPRLSI